MRILVALLQLLFGLGFGYVLFWWTRVRPELIGWNTATLIAGWTVLAVAAVANVANSCRLLWRRRTAGEGGTKFLPRLSGAAAALAFALLRADMWYVETRPMYGNAASALGKPFAMKFTAMDSRVVDVEALKGKVVLVNFWATWCGPCRSEIPHLKAVYEKWHDKGLEIIGISLDSDDKALRRFVQEKALPWPNHFDGKGWDNEFRRQYRIHGIPQLWLVDRQGVLRELAADLDLEETIARFMR